MTRIIVNADDFGASVLVNKEIERIVNVIDDEAPVINAPEKIEVKSCQKEIITQRLMFFSTCEDRCYEACICHKQLILFLCLYVHFNFCLVDSCIK